MATVSGLVDAGGRVGHLLEVELRNVGASDPRRDRQAAVDIAERGSLDRRVGIVRGVTLTDPPARPVGREIESTLIGKFALGPIAVSTRVDDLRITGADLLDVDAHPLSRIR